MDWTDGGDGVLLYSEASWLFRWEHEGAKSYLLLHANELKAGLFKKKEKKKRTLSRIYLILNLN